MAAHLVDVVAHELGHAVVDGGVEDLVELGDVDGAVASGGGGVRRGGGGGGGGAAVEDARGGARGVRGAEGGHAGELRGRAVSQRGERRLEGRRGAPWSRRIRRSTRHELGIDPEGSEPSFGVQTLTTEPTPRARARVRVRGKARGRRVERSDRTVERSSECARGSEPAPFEIESPRSHRSRARARRATVDDIGARRGSSRFVRGDVHPRLGGARIHSTRARSTPRPPPRAAISSA